MQMKLHVIKLIYCARDWRFINGIIPKSAGVSKNCISTLLQRLLMIFNTKTQRKFL